MSSSDKDFGDALEMFIEKHKMYHFEGYEGVENLLRIVGALKYNTLEDMLADNSGMIDAMIEWLTLRESDEWRDRILNEISKEDGYDYN